MIPDMNTIPVVDDETIREPEIMTSRTYRVANGRIVGFIDGIDAMKQAVTKRLMTERYVYDIYDDTYGIQIVDLIGKEFGYVAGELQLRIKETLLNDDRISDVTDFTVARNKDSVAVGFTVVCIFGSFTDQLKVTI